MIAVGMSTLWWTLGTVAFAIVIIGIVIEEIRISDEEGDK